MTTFKTKTKAIGLLLFSALMLPSCSDMDEYYEEPDWIAGSIYEKLAADGQHNIFIRGAERAELKPMLDGKSILTVMAPDDQAMTDYLAKNHGGKSIDELSVEEVKKLIGFHILYYSFDKEKLINFRPDDGDAMTKKEREAATDAGLYYKFRTKSQDPISKENDTANVYHWDRFVPVFSYKMFESKKNKKGIDAKTNYEYFYPETGWNGDGGFQVANANVTEYTNIAKNGYIYKIDRVLKPLATLYDEMKQSGKYTRFLNYYDSYRNYVYNEEMTERYGGGKKLYDIVFNRNATTALPPIASEWPVNDYSQIATLARTTYSIFAPTDEALENFFQKYWAKGGFSSLDEVSPSYVQTILKHSIYSESKEFAKYANEQERVLSIVFPEEIEAGLVHDSEGQVIKFDTQKVPQADRIICSNGVLYGCSELTPPAKFFSVSGPVYQYKNFSTFQLMLASTGYETMLSDEDARYIVLYPDNQQLKDYGKIDVNAEGLLTSEDYPAGMSADRNRSFSLPYAGTHIVAIEDDNTTIPTTGTKVYPTVNTAAKVYLYVKDGEITNSLKHNNLLKYSGNTTQHSDVWAPFKPLDYLGNIDGWNNGHAYSYSGLLFEGNYNNVQQPNFVGLMRDHRADATTEFYAWINLLDRANAMDGSTVTFMTDNCLMFVPTTLKLEQAIIDGRIPGVTATGTTAGAADFFDHLAVSDQETLQEYLKLYFVPLSTAVIENYPYVGWGEDTSLSGGLVTFQQHEETLNGKTIIVSTNLEVRDEGDRLSVGIVDKEDGTASKRVPVSPSYNYFPFIFKDGAAHILDDVL